MNTNPSDGQPDRILIGTHTYTDIGRLDVIRTTIKNATVGVQLEEPEVPTFLNQIRITSPVAQGARVILGGLLTIIEGSGQNAIDAKTENQFGESDIAITVKNSTFVGGGNPGSAPIKIEAECHQGQVQGGQRQEEAGIRKSRHLRSALFELQRG